MKNSIFTLAAILFILNSWVSYDRKMLKNDLSAISKNDPSSINGKYRARGYEHINSGRTESDKIIGFTEMLKLQNPKLRDCDVLQIRSQKLNKKQIELQFTLFRNDSIQFAFNYKVTIRKV